MGVGKTGDSLKRPAPPTVLPTVSNKALEMGRVNANSMAIMVDAKP